MMVIIVVYTTDWTGLLVMDSSDNDGDFKFVFTPLVHILEFIIEINYVRCY